MLMITFTNDVERTHLVAPLGHDSDPGIARELRAHHNSCRTCREVEAEVAALLECFRSAPVPPLPPDLEQRLLAACLNCDSALPIPRGDDGPAIIML
jgi:hypothetical protein